MSIVTIWSVFLNPVTNINAMSESSEPSSEPENKRLWLSLSLKRKKADVDGSNLKDSTNTHH